MINDLAKFLLKHYCLGFCYLDVHKMFIILSNSFHLLSIILLLCLLFG